MSSTRPTPAATHTEPAFSDATTPGQLTPRLGPELSIIAPTFNERGNILELFERLRACLTAHRWEIIFVDDDSPDQTAEEVRALARVDARVRCIQRIGRRGLSSACIEGMLASSAPYLAVMDADLQHDERLLPKMLEVLRLGNVDIVVASRYIGGGGIGAWNPVRAALSKLATRISQAIVPYQLTDPMSGYFMLRRDALNATVHELSAIGFKILLDLFASSPRTLRFVEVPYEFRNRVRGDSKFDSAAAWDYGMLLIDKSIGHVLPPRFVAFSLVGGAGVIVHFLMLVVLFKALRTPFVPAQASAALAAMVFNFTLNNLLTYRDQRLRGRKWVHGLLTFALACSIGALANVGIASYLYRTRLEWIPAAMAGVLVGAVFNYATTMQFTWGSARRF
jgi:dolichol-phosphate mannosyltransferase